MQRVYKMSSMYGLGDNIYQRAFIKEKQDALCILDTPFPEIYEDLKNVYFEPCKTNLRTQKKNAKRTDYCGRQAANISAKTCKVINLGQIRYTDTGILDGMQKIFKSDYKRIDLPSYPIANKFEGRKYAVIRPVTVRKEWHSDARNPLPEYINKAVSALKARGIITVSIADVDGINETFVGSPPVCDFNYNEGQLHIREMLNLIEHAEIVVGGIGWLVPAAIAYETKACFISGGWGTYNHPEKLLPNYETNNIKFLMPDEFCMCRKSDHDCNKIITNFESKLNQVLGV